MRRDCPGRVVIWTQPHYFFPLCNNVNSSPSLYSSIILPLSLSPSFHLFIPPFFHSFLLSVPSSFHPFLLPSLPPTFDSQSLSFTDEWIFLKYASQSLRTCVCPTFAPALWSAENGTTQSRPSSTLISTRGVLNLLPLNVSVSTPVQ